MVVKNKSLRVVATFRKLLNKKLLDANKTVKKGTRTKNKVLDFFSFHGRWPSRLAKNKLERTLATSFENYVSKESRHYDRNFRRLAMATGRTTNNKRGHAVKNNKNLILEFIKEHGRVPHVKACYEQIEGEHFLRSRLDYYTQEAGDMTFLGQVYDLDPCHKSGIPNKYRPLINESLNVEKPLIRLVGEKIIMPYIKPEEKERWEGTLQQMQLSMNIGGITPGDLNYLLTRIVHMYMNRKGLSYTHLNDIVGVFESAKAEFQRRIVGPYENSKILSNGDVP